MHTRHNHGGDNFKQVLLADDDDALRLLLATHLRGIGYEVLEFADGETLLECVGLLMSRSEGQALRHVILDVKMPGLSGLQILTSLRLAGWVGPVVVLTALRGGRATQAIRLGATALLHKPCQPREVSTLLSRIERRAPGSLPAGASWNMTSRFLGV